MSIIKLVADLFALLRWLANWITAEENKQAGRDEVSAQVNKEATDAQDRMAKVPDNPSNDDVANRMRDGSFLLGSQDQLSNDQVLRQGDTREGARRISEGWTRD